MASYKEMVVSWEIKVSNKINILQFTFHNAFLRFQNTEKPHLLQDIFNGHVYPKGL